MIQYIDRDLLICNASQPNDKDSTGLEFLIASGDSGGGLFIDGKRWYQLWSDGSIGKQILHTATSRYIQELALILDGLKTI